MTVDGDDLPCAMNGCDHRDHPDRAPKPTAADTERQVHRLSRQWWAISIACIGLWLTAGAVWVAAGNWPAALSDLAFACFTAFYLVSLRAAEKENAELRRLRFDQFLRSLDRIAAMGRDPDDTSTPPSERIRRIPFNDPETS
jgi:hypothetical protein